MLHIGHQRKELDIELEGNKLTQGQIRVDAKTQRERGTSKTAGRSERVESS